MALNNALKNTSLYLIFIAVSQEDRQFISNKFDKKLEMETFLFFVFLTRLSEKWKIMFLKGKKKEL